MTKRTLWITALVLLALSTDVYASKANEWRFESGKDFNVGKLSGLALNDEGVIAIAPGLKRTEVDADLIHCWARDGDKLWLGTGLSSKVFLMSGGKVKEVAKIGGALVGSLATDGKGGVYAGTVGRGKIVHVSSSGKVTEVVKLAGVRYVWALLRRGDKLYAGTGKGGGVFEIDLDSKKAKLYAETGAEHVLTLIEDKDSLVAGTSDAATLVRITGEKKVRAIAGFPGREVRSVVRMGDALYATVNGGDSAATLSRLRPTARRPGGISKSKVLRKKKRKTKRRRGGSGAVWVLHDDGRLNRLMVSPSGMLSQVTSAGGKVIAGASREGRVVSSDRSGSVTSLFDLGEVQVLGVEASKGRLRSVFTGRGASVYQVSGSPEAPTFTTEVLRETGISRWGRIAAAGTGKLIIESRSGFSNPPSDTWSDWQKVKDGRSQSPAATYLQVRVRFDSDDATLSQLRIFRRTLNRRPTITSLTTKPYAKTKTIKIRWRSRDADLDKLGYVVTYRKVGTKQWISLHDRYYTKTSMTLSPKDMPDGWYELRVEASDAPTNPSAEALTAALISAPFLVDQGRPTVKASVSGGVVKGAASDATSRIQTVVISVDGAPPAQTSPKDGIWDSLKESFSFKLPAHARSGKHTLLIQATDAAGNTGVTRLVIGD